MQLHTRVWVVAVTLSSPVRITLIYLVVGGMWISLSDRFVALLVADPASITWLQTVKGWGYILLTGLLLFVLVRRDFERIKDAQHSLEQSYDATLKGWARALDLRDRSTEQHTARVADLAIELAQEMGLSEPDLTYIHRGALLHDIGKMGIPDGILLKPGPLDAAEWAVMRQHPRYAYELLTPIEHLRPVIDIPYCHHEKWDGSGYPRGLRGEAIPLSARIFAVADVWDALTSSRPYRLAWTPERAIEYLRAQSGQHFDPIVVAAFERWNVRRPTSPEDRSAVADPPLSGG